MSVRAEDVAGVLIDASIRAAAVFVVIGAALLLLRVRAGAVRHAAWAAVLFAMLTVPFVPRWIPALPFAWPFTTQNTPSWGQAPVVRVGDRLIKPVDVRERLRQFRVQIDASKGTNRLVFHDPSVPRRYFGFTWFQIATGLWLAGILVLGARLMLGWRRASKLASSSRAAGDGFYQSELVTTPIGVGVFAPKVILPPDWESWPEDVRRAVMIHEQAHIRRRDALVGLLAKINRCIYWFNPLAWWLERRLRISAEEACDDEVIRALVDPERYAALLLQMADVVRRNGGRVSWHAVGITSGAIAQRIDRVVSGKASRRPTVMLRIAIALICVGAVAVGVGCRARQEAQPGVWADRPDGYWQSGQWKTFAKDNLVSPIPKLLPPAGVTIPSSGGSGPAGILSERPLKIGEAAPASWYQTHLNYRLNTSASTSSLVEHYVPQLTAAGWKVAFTSVDSQLGLVRFAVGTDADPMTGTLMVVPLPAVQQTMVVARLVRSKYVWRTGRAGGGGASTREPLSVRLGGAEPAGWRFFSLPLTVTRVETREAGGSTDFSDTTARIEGPVAPQALMLTLGKQLVVRGWSIDFRGGDGVQSTIKLSTQNDNGISAVLTLTRMPGTVDTDVVLTSIRNKR